MEWTGKHPGLIPPLGICYIGAVLRDAGFGVSALDLRLGGFDAHAFRRVLKSECPRILGISALSETYFCALQIAHIAKEVDREMAVVIGGAYVTGLHEQAAADKSIDVVVMGEGEYTMLDLANHYINGSLNLSQIQGIAFRDNGAIRVTDDRPLPDLDLLPYPARTLLSPQDYRFPGAILWSRSGYAVTSDSRGFDARQRLCRRFRDPQRVAQEIMFLLEQQQTKSIVFADDSFTLDRRRVLALCYFMRQLKKPVRWRCTTRVDLVDQELLEKMRQSGCQSVRYEVHAGFRRKFDCPEETTRLTQLSDAAALALDAGINVSFFSSPRLLKHQTARENMRPEEALPGHAVKDTASVPEPLLRSVDFEQLPIRTPQPAASSRKGGTRTRSAVARRHS